MIGDVDPDRIAAGLESDKRASSAGLRAMGAAHVDFVPFGGR